MPPTPEEIICSFCMVKRSEMCRYVAGLGAYICSLCDKNPSVAEPQMDMVKHQPWNDREVESLSQYQQDAMYCPYVCDKMHKLIVANDGLHCKDCGFKLGWAYKWTLDGTWRPMRPPTATPVPKDPTKPVITEEIALPLPKKEEELV
jgi:hypothetical protein